jgi:uncharacterized membrane protein
VLVSAVLLVATLAVALIRPGGGWRHHARWGLAVAMVFAGVSHLLMPTPFVQHLPEWVPGRDPLVALTGVLEIALGVALVYSKQRRSLAGLAVAAFLVAVFPANVYVAVAAVDVEGQPGGAYPWIRLPFQALFIAWALWSTRPQPAPAAQRPEVEGADGPHDLAPPRTGLGSAGGAHTSGRV